MFKFLKSKKGFTLVELMIVVVIMAILVAVAVPIYSAVTANARKKTCIGNQRNIISQINNSVMSDPGILIAPAAGADIVINSNPNGDGVGEITDAGVFDSTGAKFKTMFNASNMPYCPEKSGKLTVTVTPGTDAGSCTIKVVCDKGHAA